MTRHNVTGPRDFVHLVDVERSRLANGSMILQLAISCGCTALARFIMPISRLRFCIRN